ncbi:MAG: ferredoxin [Clostridiales bacterium]|jgi:ferredoxin|nr:ferredoxin [Clostridiales bacterium]
MKVFVDQDLCISCGLCISICEDVFSWNEDDKAEAIDDEIPEDLVEDVEEAVESCPTEAIKYQE